MSKSVLKECLAVASGGFIGGILRAMMMIICHTNHFPWATIIVNISGTFISAFLVIIFSQMVRLSQTTSSFIMIGILGAYTTYSTALVDMIDQTFWPAFLYLVISIVGGVIAVIISRYLGHKVVLIWQK